MWRGWFRPHFIYRELREWYEDGEEQSAGDSWDTSRRFKSLDLEGPFPLDELRIKPTQREEATLGSYYWPNGPLALLLAPHDKGIRPKRPVENTVEYSPPAVKLRVLRNGTWVAAELDDAVPAWARMPEGKRTPSISPHRPESTSPNHV